MNPLVTVVTPSFNQAQFLEETILSVLNQDYPNIEYIIIDGGSTDGSVDIIHKYKDRLSHWVSEPDKGQADAINKGWRLARGEIVAYLNSDDVYEPEALAVIAERFQAHPEAEVIYGDARLIDETGGEIGQFPAGAFDYLTFVRTCRNPIPQPSAFIRRATLAEVGFLDPSLHFVIDFELWCRVGRRSKMLYLPGMLSRIRIQPNSKTRTIKMVAAFEMVQVCERLFAYPTLHQNLKSTRAEAMANAYASAGEYAYAAACPKETRAYLQQAFMYFPLHLANFELVSKFLFSLLGSGFMRFTRRIAQHWAKGPIY